MNQKPHDVVFSVAEHERDRFICRTCNQEVVWRSFMSEEAWSQAYAEFKNKHPFETAPQVMPERKKRWPKR